MLWRAVYDFALLFSSCLCGAWRLVRAERWTTSPAFTVPAHSPTHGQPSRFPGICLSFSKTPVNIFSPLFFHHSFWSACSSPAYSAASGSHGVEPLSLIDFWLMNYGQCLHKDPSQMKTSLRMESLRVPWVRPALFSGEGASAECQARSAPCNGHCVCAAAVAGKVVFKAVLVLGRGHGKQSKSEWQSSPFILRFSCFLEYMLIS